MIYVQIKDDNDGVISVVRSSCVSPKSDDEQKAQKLFQFCQIHCETAVCQSLNRSVNFVWFVMVVHVYFL